ncbi:MAG: SUMF1/EgtB/PvdO family nonheme iron enzyme, partial [Chloroflexota bacterium]
MSDLNAIIEIILQYKWVAILILLGLAAWFVLKAYGGGILKAIEDFGKKDAERVIQKVEISDTTRDYLNQAVITYSRFKFRGLPTHVAKHDANRLSLDQAYVSLRVMPQGAQSEDALDEISSKQSAKQLFRMAKSEALSLPQVLKELKERRLAIIGIAGSGKSTLLQWAGLACARALLGEKSTLLSKEQAELIQVFGGKAPFPIFIPLRAYNEYCKQNNKARTVKSLLDFLPTYFSEDQARCEFTAEFFKAHLQKNCLLMFDGVDEVEPDDRPGVQNAVEKFIVSFDHPNLYCLISSRPSASYVSDQMEGFQRCEVQRLNIEQRYDLIHFWHRAVYAENPSSGDKKADELNQRIRSASTQVQELATTPLMVTIFCMVSYSHELPRLRAKLYEDAIAVLLTDTVHHEGDFYKGLAEWGGKDWEDRRDHLALIAFKMQAQKVIQLPETDLVELIWKEFGPDPETARKSTREFLRMVAQRGGLLEAVDNEYGFFTHATFQEYLAGRYLAEEIVDPDEQQALLANYFADDKWWETLRLAAGYLSIGGKSKADAFVNLLAGLGKTPEDKAKALALAGECLVDMRKREPQTVESIGSKIEAAITANPPYAPVLLRQRLGLALGGLGDPRLKSLEPEVCPMPAGTFRMGTSEADQEILKEQKADFYGDESPDHEVFVSGFSIAKYPVTNLEFRAFYEAKGYETPDFWSKDGLDWLEGKWKPDLSFIADKELRGQYKEWLERRLPELRHQPFFWDDPKWNAPNLPVVGVSWFEAEAYCNWLSRVTGQNYRLPTEA